MPSTATVQVRQTTTTTTSRASVIVINSGYLTSKLGLIKLILLIVSLICFILLLLEATYNYQPYRSYYHYIYPPADQFLILVCFANWYAITLMLISALLSLGTASLLTKTSFDFIFHFVACVLYLIGGLWVAVGAFGSYNRSFKVQTASILALVCGIIHLVHGVFSYRNCITN